MTNRERVGFSDRWLAPWIGGLRLITLWDMKEYLAPRLVEASAGLSVALISFTAKDDPELTPEARKEIQSFLSQFVRETEFLGLHITTKFAKKFAESASSANSAELDRQFDLTHETFQAEAGALPLFYVPQDKLKFYNKTDLFGDEFKTKFPSANVEIIEAGNCFAFDRFTACVFHLMRAMEIAPCGCSSSLWGLPPRIWSTTKVEPNLKAN